MITDALIERIVGLQNPTCVGLDTSFDYLPEKMREGVKDFSAAAERIFEFNKQLVDHLYDDIGSTAACYSTAFLGETSVEGMRSRAFPADYVTVNGYLGTDGIQPFVKDCAEKDRGIFVLVKTSNPSSGELQNRLFDDGTPVYEYMGGLVEKWGAGTEGRYGYSAVGAVVGATHPEEAARLRKLLPHTFFLIPGYGAQGANAEMLFRRGRAGRRRQQFARNPLRVQKRRRAVLRVCAESRDRHAGGSVPHDRENGTVTFVSCR